MRTRLKNTEKTTQAENVPAKKAWKKSKLDHVPIVDDAAGQKYSWNREFFFYGYQFRPRNAS